MHLALEPRFLHVHGVKAMLLYVYLLDWFAGYTCVRNYYVQACAHVAIHVCAIIFQKVRQNGSS